MVFDQSWIATPEPGPARLPFKMLTHRRMIKCIQPRDWFAAIDLKDAYFHVSILPRHRPFYGLRPRVGHGSTGSSPSGSPCPPVSSRRSRRVPLPRYGKWASGSSTVSSMARTREQLCDHRDLVLRHLSQLGLRVNWEKSKLSPAQRISFLGVELDSVSMSARLTEERAQSVLNCLSSFGGRTVVPLKTVSEAPGAYGIRSRGHAARIASYETTSALVTLPSPEVGMAPRCTSGEHHTGVSPLLQPLDRPCLSTGRGALRTSVSSCCRHDRCLQHGLGRYMQRAGSLGALDGASTALAHHCLELLAVHLALRQFRPLLLGKHVLVRTDNTAAVSYINRMGDIRSRRMSQLARHLLLWSHTRLQIAARCPHSGGAQSCGRRALTTAHFPGEWRLPSRDDPADLESIRRSSGGPVCFSRVLPLPVVFLPDRGLPRHGRTGTQLASGSMQICISPVSLLAQTLCKVREDEEQVLLVAPFWPTRTWFSRTHSPRDSPSLAHSSEEGLPFSGARHHWHPRPDLCNLHVWLLDGTRQT